MKEFWKSVRIMGTFLHLTLHTPQHLLTAGLLRVGGVRSVFLLHIFSYIVSREQKRSIGEILCFTAVSFDCGSELLGGSCFQLQKGSGLSGKTGLVFAA